MNTDPNPTVITRIPPSPTGHLHIGTARTALFNYLYAKQQGGQFVFRSEDTDRARSTQAYEEEIQTGLKWLGITWDNETITRQSEQSVTYRKYLEQLIEKDLAYISSEPSKQDPSSTVDLVRVRNPSTTVVFTDLVRGEITFDTTELGDFVIARSLDDALYHFTVVVDDAEMKVTHVLRGEDHISNTPRQIVLLEALGFTRPQYAHLPLILAPDRSKMSKRHGAVAIAEYQEQGYLPEAILNYLALLGWNPGTEQEIFTLNELIQEFSIEKIQKGGAVFNLEKLSWIHKQHLQAKDIATQETYVLDAVNSAMPDLNQSIRDRFARLTSSVLERHVTKKAIQEALSAGEFDFVINDPDPDPQLLAWKKDPDATAAVPRLQAAKDALVDADFTSSEAIKDAVWPLTETFGRGELLWPLRTALTGQERSPDPFTVAYTLGKDTTLTRIDIACAKITA